MLGRAVRRKLPLPKQNMVAWLRFAKLHLNKPHDFWNNVKKTRPKWKCLAIMHSAMFGEKKTKHSISAQTPHTNCQALWLDDLGLIFSQRTWALCSL